MVEFILVAFVAYVWLLVGWAIPLKRRNERGQ